MTDLNVTTQTPATIDMDVPPEPALWSVVIDCDGTAWQSRPYLGSQAIWWSAGSRSLINITWEPQYGSTRWSALLVERKPLMLVHRGDQPVIFDV